MRRNPLHTTPASAATRARVGKSHYRRMRGFTLLELMIAVVILVILLAIAVPSFQSLMASNRLTGVTNEFIAALNTARAEAIRRGQRVTLCTSSSGTACTATDWTQGWILFNDSTSDPTKDAAFDGSPETIIRTGGPAASGISITGNSNVDRYISYTADGTAKLTTNAFQAGTIRVVINSAALTQNVNCIVLSSGGRIRVNQPATHDGVCS